MGMMLAKGVRGSRLHRRKGRVGNCGREGSGAVGVGVVVAEVVAVAAATGGGRDRTRESG